MLIRFNRSQAVRQAYKIYDSGRYGKVIEYCSAQLAKPGSDPELRLLRGMAYLDHLDCGHPNEAMADWRECFQDEHIAAIAHYYLGNFLATMSLEDKKEAWRHFEEAAQLGWVEGNIGKGFVLMDWGCVARDDENQPEAAQEFFLRSIGELTIGLTSPAPHSRRRALGLRASAYYNAGNLEGCKQDKAQEKLIVIGDSAYEADLRATGAELFS